MSRPARSAAGSSTGPFVSICWPGTSLRPDADLTQARDACARELAAALDSGESSHAVTVLAALAALRLPAGDLLGARREVARLLVADVARDAGPPSPAQLDRLRAVRALVPAADWREIVQASAAARRTRQQ